MSIILAVARKMLPQHSSIRLELNQPLQEVFQIRTFQTDNPNAHSQRLLPGCGLWLVHHLICCWEWARALQQASVLLFKECQGNAGCLAAQWKHLDLMTMIFNDDDLWSYIFSFSIKMIFPLYFTLTAQLFFCPNVSFTWGSCGNGTVHICKQCTFVCILWMQRITTGGFACYTNENL